MLMLWEYRLDGGDCLVLLSRGRGERHWVGFAVVIVTALFLFLLRWCCYFEKP